MATLKSLMGTECKKILKRLQLSADKMKEPEVILGKLEANFVPERNILCERNNWHTKPSTSLLLNYANSPSHANLALSKTKKVRD